MKKKTIKKNSTSNTSGESDSGLPETRASDVEKNISVEVKPKTQRRRFTAKYKVMAKPENVPWRTNSGFLKNMRMLSAERKEHCFDAKVYLVLKL